MHFRLNAFPLNLLLAAAYFGTGRVSILLAPDPSYATGIWPAAGLAFVAVLCGGFRYLPGVFLGASILNFMLLSDISHALSPGGTVVMAMVIGIGAAFQAAVGAGLVRHFIGYPTKLDRLEAILKFLILAGPVACTVSASIATAALYGGGIFALEPVAVHWLTWWLGDVTGVILFGLLGLSLVGRPRRVWRPRLLSVAVPMLLASLPVVVAQVTSSFLLSRQQHAEFDFAARTVQHELQHVVALHNRTLSSLAALFEGSERVRPGEFNRVAASRLQEAPAVDWLGRMPTAGDSLHESLRKASSQSVMASERKRLFDLARDDGVRAALRERDPFRTSFNHAGEAFHMAGPHASDRLLSSGQAIENDDSWLIRTRDTPESMIMALVNLPRLAATIVPDGFEGPLDVRLSNDGTGEASRVIGHNGVTAQLPFHRTDEIELNGRAFRLDVRGLPGDYRQTWLIHALVTAGAGVVFCLLLTLLLLTQSSHRFRADESFQRAAGCRAVRRPG